jgi:hypothetical protein
MKKLILLMLVLVLAVSLNSCKKETPVDNSTPYDNSQGEFMIQEETLDAEFVVETMTADFQDATETNEMFIYQNPKNGKLDPGRQQKPPKIFPFLRILNQLELTDEQKASVKEFINEYNATVREAMIALRESQKKILDAAKDEYKKIMEDLKNGVITRQEAKEKLKALNKRVREALKNNPANARVKNIIDTARQTLLDNIRSILTDDQKVKWDEWLAKFKERGR